MSPLCPSVISDFNRLQQMSEALTVLAQIWTLISGQRFPSHSICVLHREQDQLLVKTLPYALNWVNTAPAACAVNRHNCKRDCPVAPLTHCWYLCFSMSFFQVPWPTLYMYAQVWFGGGVLVCEHSKWVNLNKPVALTLFRQVQREFYVRSVEWICVVYNTTQHHPVCKFCYSVFRTSSPEEPQHSSHPLCVGRVSNNCRSPPSWGHLKIIHALYLHVVRWITPTNAVSHLNAFVWQELLCWEVFVCICVYCQLPETLFPVLQSAAFLVRGHI